jgi:hypothetical protein
VVRATDNVVEVGGDGVVDEVPPVHAPLTARKAINHRLQDRIRGSYSPPETPLQVE